MGNVCCVYGCSNCSGREKDRSFHRILAVITNQGKETEELTTERRKKWTDAINRKSFNEKSEHNRACSDHFIEGE